MKTTQKIGNVPAPSQGYRLLSLHAPHYDAFYVAAESCVTSIGRGCYCSAVLHRTSICYCELEVTIFGGSRRHAGIRDSIPKSTNYQTLPQAMSSKVSKNKGESFRAHGGKFVR
jgi:hypothetical protein